MNYLDELKQEIQAAALLAIRCLPVTKASITFTLRTGDDPTRRSTEVTSRLNIDLDRCIRYAEEAARVALECTSYQQALHAFRFAKLAEDIERRLALLSTNTPPLYPSLAFLVMTPLLARCQELVECYRTQTN